MIVPSPWVFLVFCVTLSGVAQSASVAQPTAQRPPYSTGNGFYVDNGKLYDPNGIEFRIRGVNRLHCDSSSAADIARSHANTVRWTIDFTRSAKTNVEEITAQSNDNGSVPIVGNWNGTCNTDTSKLSSI